MKNQMNYPKASYLPDFDSFMKRNPKYLMTVSFKIIESDYLGPNRRNFIKGLARARFLKFCNAAITLKRDIMKIAKKHYKNLVWRDDYYLTDQFYGPKYLHQMSSAHVSLNFYRDWKRLYRLRKVNNIVVESHYGDLSLNNKIFCYWNKIPYYAIRTKTQLVTLKISSDSLLTYLFKFMVPPLWEKINVAIEGQFKKTEFNEVSTGLKGCIKKVITSSLAVKSENFYNLKHLQLNLTNGSTFYYDFGNLASNEAFKKITDLEINLDDRYSALNWSLPVFKFPSKVKNLSIKVTNRARSIHTKKLFFESFKHLYFLEKISLSIGFTAECDPNTVEFARQILKSLKFPKSISLELYGCSEAIILDTDIFCADCIKFAKRFEYKNYYLKLYGTLGASFSAYFLTELNLTFISIAVEAIAFITRENFPKLQSLILSKISISSRKESEKLFALAADFSSCSGCIVVDVNESKNIFFIRQVLAFIQKTPWNVKWKLQISFSYFGELIKHDINNLMEYLKRKCFSLFLNINCDKYYLSSKREKGITEVTYEHGFGYEGGSESEKTETEEL